MMQTSFIGLRSKDGKHDHGNNFYSVGNTRLGNS